MAYKIVLDAGHGGEDPGAVWQGRNEKDDTLKLTLAVGEILENNGFDVVYTRTTDVYQTPFEKAQIANRSGADFFVSIHRNSSPRPNQYSMTNRALSFRWRKILTMLWKRWGLRIWE